MNRKVMAVDPYFRQTFIFIMSFSTSAHIETNTNTCIRTQQNSINSILYSDWLSTLSHVDNLITATPPSHPSIIIIIINWRGHDWMNTINIIAV